MKTEIPANIQAAVDAAVASGLPQPTTVFPGDNPDPFINLYFGLNDTADVDAWAAYVGATVGHVPYTYGEVDEFDNVIDAPCHEYGTAADNGVHGRWLGARVGLGCEVLGPHPRTV
jgi:hypothetical protein